MSYAYVAATVLLTVAGQLVMKWQVSREGLPDPSNRLALLWHLLGNPWVLASLAAGLAAALCWMLALNRLPLSRAYPFTSLSFVLVLFLGAWLLGEPLSWPKVAGVALIVAGVAIGSQG